MSTVIGELYVDGIAELSATIFGDADAHTFIGGALNGSFTPNQEWQYYIYGNVTVGFDPTDDPSGTDGNIIDFNRYLGLLTNINVAFDHTDDASGNPGFVSQTYPDGDIIRDFARYKYQYLLVIPGIVPPDCRLTIGPAPRSPNDLTPTPKPPRRQPGKR